MIKICHETPKALFEEAKKFNDYDYYLDYLWEDEEYCNFFKEELQRGRTIIMDSSLFEFHPIVPPIDRFFEHVKEFGKYGKNLEYIVVDVLDNADATIQKFEEWEEHYRSAAPGKAVGVIQGNTVRELDECYGYMSEHADKIAIPFDSAGFDELVTDAVPDMKNCRRQDRLFGKSLGRRRYIEHLVNDKIWNKNKPHHLLGCSFAWEFAHPLYHKMSIESLDTSSPIICGIHKIAYTEEGNPSKPTTKLCDLINYKPSPSEEALILENVRKFRELVASASTSRKK